MFSEEPKGGSVDTDDASIRSARLILRPLRATDAEELARLAGDIRIARMTARIPHPYTIDHARFFIEEPGEDFVRAVTCAQTGRLLGVAGFKPAEAPAVELGYWIGSDHWGKGFATEAAQALVDFAFANPLIECVWARCRAINGASRRVLEKSGFQMRRMGTMDTLYAGRVSAEEFQLDRGAWAALKAWGAGRA